MNHLETGINRDTELRKVSVQVTQNLAKLLDGDDSILSILMGNIVKDLDNPATSELRFTSNDIDQIRDHAQTIRKSPILILLDEWSTMGRNRPKLRHLLALFTKCQLFRAADYISDLINEPKPERPEDGPAARVNLDLPEDIEGVVNGMDYPFTGSDLNFNRPDNRPEINSPNINLNFPSPSDVSTINNMSSSPFKPIESYIPAYSVSFNSPSNQSRDLITFSKSQQATTSQVSHSSEPYIPALSLLNAKDTEEIVSQPRTIQGASAVQSAELPAFNDILQTQSQSTSNGDANIPLMSSLFINNSNTESRQFNTPQTSEHDSSNIPVFSQLFNGNSTSQSQTRISRMSENSLSSISTDNE